LKEKESLSIEESLGGNSSKGEEDEESKGNREPKETSMGPPTHSALSGLAALAEDTLVGIMGNSQVQIRSEIHQLGQRWGQQKFLRSLK
jgi:hypothetical protein